MQRNISKQWHQLDVGMTCLECLWNCLFWELVKARLGKELCGGLSQEWQAFARNELHGPGSLFQLTASLLWLCAMCIMWVVSFVKGFSLCYSTPVCGAWGESKTPSLLLQQWGAFLLTGHGTILLALATWLVPLVAWHRRTLQLCLLMMRSGRQCCFFPLSCKIGYSIW